jgi:hypothetical protein
MNNQLNLLIIGVGIVIAVVGCGLLLNPALMSIGYSLIQKGVGFAVLFTIALLLRNGTFMYSRYFKVMNLMIAVVICGALLRILHVSGANILFLAACAGIIIIYTAWFVVKKKQHLSLDILKLLWAITFFAASDFKLNHWLYAGTLSNIADILLLLALANYLWIQRNTRSREKVEGIE